MQSKRPDWLHSVGSSPSTHPELLVLALVELVELVVDSVVVVAVEEATVVVWEPGEFVISTSAQFDQI